MTMERDYCMDGCCGEFCECLIGYAMNIVVDTWVDFVYEGVVNTCVNLVVETGMNFWMDFGPRRVSVEPVHPRRRADRREY